MTDDATLRDQAVAELRLTTVGLKGKNPPPVPHWANALDLLAKIGVPPTTAGVLRGVGADETDITGWQDLGAYQMVMVGDQPASLAAAKALPQKPIIVTYSDAQIVETNRTWGLTFAEVQANGWALGYRASDGAAYLDLTKPACVTAMAEAMAAFAASQGTGLFADDMTPVSVGPARPAGFKEGMVSLASQLHAAMGGNYLLCNALGFGDASLGNQDDGESDINWQALFPTGSGIGMYQEEWEQDRNGSDVLRVDGTDWTQCYQQWLEVPKAALARGQDYWGATNGAGNPALYGYGSLLNNITIPAGRKLGFFSYHRDGSDQYGPWVTATKITVDSVNGTAVPG